MQEMSKKSSNIQSPTSPGRVKSDSDLWLLIICLVTSAIENGTDRVWKGHALGGLLDTHMERSPWIHRSGIQGDLNLEVAKSGSGRKMHSPPKFKSQTFTTRLCFKEKSNTS